MSGHCKHREEDLVPLVENGTLQIREDGTIWNTRTGRRPEMQPRPNWYFIVRVMTNGNRPHVLSHRLIYRMAHGRIPDGMEINHKNGIKYDNRLENLEIVTPSGNRKHAYANGLQNEDGERNPACTVPDEVVRRIKEDYSTGRYSMEEVGALHGVNIQYVQKVVSGRRRSTAGGVTVKPKPRNWRCVQDPQTGQFVKRTTSGHLLDGVEHREVP